jgi:hypothetical protein
MASTQPTGPAFMSGGNFVDNQPGLEGTGDYASFPDTGSSITSLDSIDNAKPVKFGTTKNPSKNLDTKQVDAYIKKLDKLKAQFQGIKEKQKVDVEREKLLQASNIEFKPIKKIEYTVGKTFFVNPILDTVPNPLKYGIDGVNHQVRVASKAWLQALDRMRAVNWPLDGKHLI